MTQTITSPKIADISWGQTSVEGQRQTFKDVKLYPGGARAWDWNETGTRHSPGIQPADVQELLDNGAQVIVLSKGFNERLQVQPETLDLLREQGVDVHVLQTEQAVKRYNELAGEQPAGALIHSTC